MPKGLAITLATIAVAALVWIGAEQHYQSCVAHRAANVDATATPQAEPNVGATGVTARITRGGGCSRFPW
jgi:hypothetical protein